MSRFVARFLASIGLAVVLSATASEPSALVAVKKVRSFSTGAAFELRNVSSEPVAYMHWVTLGPEPVAYCRGGDGAVRICAPKVVLNEDDTPYTHGTYFAPGKRVRFNAIPVRGETVGVLIYVDGRETYVWSDS